MSLKWVEIFRTGRHTSSNGITRDYSPADLDQAAETYDPRHFKAPLIVSYPAHNTAGHSDGELYKSQLAFGFPDAIKRQGDRLLAGFAKISPKIKEWINNGEILGFSSSFYLPDSPHNPYPGKLALRHIAGCGINPPAVKGMETPQLAEPLSSFAHYGEGQEGAVEFGLGLDDQALADAQLGARVYRALKVINSSVSNFAWDGFNASPFAAVMREFMQRQRDRLIEEEGTETADKTFPLYLINELAAIANQPATAYATLEDLMRVHERVDALQYGKENPIFEEGVKVPGDVNAQFDELKAENKNLRQEISQIRLEREQERVTSFVDLLVRDRKILPAEAKAEIRDILNLPNDVTANYGEAGDLTPRQRYMNKLSDRRPLWSDRRLPIDPASAPSNFSDTPVYDEGYSPEGIKLDRQIRQKCAALGKDPNDVANYEEVWDLLVKEGAASKSF